MLTRIQSYLQTSISPLDRVRSLRRRRGRIALGWCSVFPPTRNGAASVAYQFVSRLMRRDDFDVYAIPWGGRIDKRLFPGIRFASLESPLDVIVFFCLGSFLGKALDRAKAKTIAWQTVHESITKDEGEKELFNQMRRVDLALTLTRGALREYREHGIGKADYVPAGIDTKIFSPSGCCERLEVLCATRVHYYKGVVAFLEAIPIVLRTHQSVNFKLHGPIDPNTNYYQEIRGLLDETLRRYPGNFSYQDHWLSYDRQADIYHSSRIFVFPSDNEGFGVPMVEAMSCGMPCIVADKPPMNEIVADNETGFCLKVRAGARERYHGYAFPHPDDIAGKVTWLADHPDELGRMSENCRKRAELEFDIGDCVAKMAGIIETVARGAAR